MPDGFCLLGDRQVILGVGAVELVAIGAPPFVEEEFGQLEIALVARYVVELYQADLDLLVAGHLAPLAGAKDLVDQVARF